MCSDGNLPVGLVQQQRKDRTTTKGVPECTHGCSNKWPKSTGGTSSVRRIVGGSSTAKRLARLGPFRPGRRGGSGSAGGASPSLASPRLCRPSPQLAPPHLRRRRPTPADRSYEPVLGATGIGDGLGPRPVSGSGAESPIGDGRSGAERPIRSRTADQEPNGRSGAEGIGKGIGPAEGVRYLRPDRARRFITGLLLRRPLGITGPFQLVSQLRSAADHDPAG